MIVILNAPPSSGKDTIAALLRHHNFAVAEMKESMFGIAYALSGLTKEVFMARYNDRELKEVPWSALGGKSCREFIIYISEDVMKPTFGSDIFGQRAADRCDFHSSCGYPHVVFSDGGFLEELIPISERNEMLVVRLHREGYTFDNDSRTYLYPEFCRSADVYLEDGKPELAVKQILDLM